MAIISSNVYVKKKARGEGKISPGGSIVKKKPFLPTEKQVL